MPPRLHLVRHAQGYHNLGPEHWSLHDPLLTDKGKQQCLELSQKFPFTSQVDLVVTSPMRRAIYTGLESFNAVFEKEHTPKLIALPDLQELSDFPCDIGTKVEDLQKEVEEANLPVDLSFVEEGWTEKNGRYEASLERIRERAQHARRWLLSRPEKDIVVVSHGGLLHFLTEDWEDACIYEGTGWANTEFRTYEFTDNAYDGVDAPMNETLDSRQRRGIHTPLPTNDQQKELCDYMLQMWAEQGYPIGPIDKNPLAEGIPAK